jgi:hypothetical protein
VHPNRRLHRARTAPNPAFAAKRGFGMLALDGGSAPLLVDVSFHVTGDISGDIPGDITAHFAAGCAELHLMRES